MNVPRGLGFLSALLAFATFAAAQGSLKIIENGLGSKIAYGPVEGQTTEAGAMGAILRGIHQHYGARPQVGKIFQVRGTNSVAVFFTVPRQGTAPRAGLLIATAIAPGHVEVAVLSDDGPRFGSTINPMLKTLVGVWHPAGETHPAPASTTTTKASAAPAATGKAAPLHEITLRDQSASVSLPDGWKILPGSGGGSLYAEGPNGESAALGFPMLAVNNAAGNPQLLHYPYGRDLTKTFIDLTQILHQKRGRAPATFEIASSEPVRALAPQRCTHILGRVDEQDGKGMKEMNTVFCSGQLGPGGIYMNIGYYTVAPLQVADRQRATMAAILGSYNVNMAVVNGQASAIAKPAIDAIHAIGKAAADRAAVESAAHDRYNQGVEQRWDEQARNNQQFSNYTLDQTVIEDRELNAHGTLWNQTADSLVRNNPDRYGYVDKPNFWKGIDY